MKEWYRQLGFHSNPFSIKPAAFSRDMIAYDLSYIFDKIRDDEMIFIEGSFGTGKTTILKNIISEFKGENKIIYYSFNKADKFDAKKLIQGANSFMRKVAGLKVKEVIMLLDEVHTMTEEEAQSLLKYYRDGTIKSVVFVSHDYDETDFPEDYEGYLSGNVIQTVNLSIPEALDLVERRIGDIDLFTKKSLKRIFKLSKKNPRRFLEYCEDIARYTVESGDTIVTDEHIDKVLDIAEKPKVTKKKVKAAKAKKTKTAKKSTKEDDIVIKEIEDKDLKVEDSNYEHETDNPVMEADVQLKPKKYKVNKLVSNSRENPLGTVSEKEEVPEYNVYVLD